MNGELFSLEDVEPWRREWRGMPEFDQEDQTPWKSIQVHFQGPGDYEAFAKLVEQKLSPRTRSIWFPEAEIGRMSNKRFISRPGDERAMPRAPIYIVSKGRHERPVTSNHLAAIGVPHNVVVEEFEADAYRAALSPLATVVVLDPAYQRDYDTFDDLGDAKSKGPGPARNFAMEHSIAAGAAWHWVMDDNLDGFYRLFQNIKTPCRTGAMFRAMEEFCARFENVTMGGPNYFMFASRKTVMPPFTRNTRIYSCNLIRNDSGYRWRGRYNEDTDISLRMLKDGNATVLFNAFLVMKMATQALKGGNTGEFYAKEGTLPKSQMQVDMHPDVSTLVWKWDRWHHHVDYSRFKSIPYRPRDEYQPPEEYVDDMGMVLQDLVGGEWVDRTESTAPAAAKYYNPEAPEPEAPDEPPPMLVDEIEQEEPEDRDGATPGGSPHREVPDPPPAPPVFPCDPIEAAAPEPEEDDPEIPDHFKEGWLFG